VSDVASLPGPILDALRSEVKAASWFAALGEPLSEGDRADAESYASALDPRSLTVEPARDWPAAERILKTPEGSRRWWDREERLRRTLLATAEARYPGRALWTALTELTTETGDLVHGKAATAAARMGKAAAASIHVAAGSASHAVYQLAVGRLAGDRLSLFESKFRLFAAGRWPLGVVGSTLFVF
jgi:hypothetical protein